MKILGLEKLLIVWLMNTAWERKCSPATMTRNLYSIGILKAKKKRKMSCEYDL